MINLLGDYSGNLKMQKCKVKYYINMLTCSVLFINKEYCRAEASSGTLTNFPK